MPGLKVYKASAGSGKTYTLALEYIKELLLKSYRHPHRQLLAVTFTKDATGEMKDRILAELYGLADACPDSEGFLHSVKEALREEKTILSDEEIQKRASRLLQEIVHDYSRLNITTIDSFFQKVLRSLARELGKGSKFNVEMNTSKVLSEAVSAMIENANEKPQLLDWLTSYMEDKLEKGENWRIENSVLSFSQCIFNEYFQEHEHTLKKQLDSNPGIFQQIWEQHAKEQKRAKDFFKRAYAEINHLLESTGLTPADFSRKGTVLTYIKKLSEGDIAGANPHSATVQDCLNEASKWASAKNKRAVEIENLAHLNLMPLLNECIETQRQYNTSQMITDNLYQLGLIWDITNEIGKQNEENNRFMLADTALFLNRMVNESDASFVYEKIGGEIRHVMIDEFQDTSRIQWKNLHSLLSNILAENNFSLIVGDVKQSIYRWRNGDWSILNGIERELGVAAHSLRFNYRSERVVIDFNNQLFVHTASLLDDKYRGVFNEQFTSPFPSVYNPKEVEQESHKKQTEGYVSIDFVPDKTEDGKYSELVLDRVLEQLVLLHQTDIPAEKICILTRTNRSIIRIAAYLSEKKEEYRELAKANYLNIVSNEAFRLNSSPTLRIIIEAIRVLVNRDDLVHKAQLQVFSDKFIQSSEADLEQILEGDTLSSGLLEEHKTLSQMPLFELIGHLFRLFQLEKIEGQSAYMFAFYDAVSNYLKEYPSDLPAFLRYWDEELQSKTIPAGTGIQGIRAMTIHKSKGLQFDTVLVPYCDWDLYPEKSPVIWCPPKAGLYPIELMPVRYSQKMYETVFLPEYEKETSQSWVDNLNLLYVAFTRAERNLIITARQKKKLASLDDIKTVSDLLQYSTIDLQGAFDEETLHFENGRLQTPLRTEEKATSSNVLKAKPETIYTSFRSEAFHSNRSIFKQSNKSQEFIHSEEESMVSRRQYIEEGNIMHALFSMIRTMEDIDDAVCQLIFTGLIPQEKKEEYARKVRKAIEDTNVAHWFSGEFRIYNECAILTEENGTVTHKQPDRVLMNGQETLIIDYKFGEPKHSHKQQVEQYSRLMRQMNYPNVKAYLWYVKKNLCTFVPLNS